MITYVVIYSIIVFLIAAVAIALSWLYVGRQRQKMRRVSSDRLFEAVGVKAFLDLVGSGEKLAFLLARSDTQLISYISPSIEGLLGLPAEEIWADAGCVRKTVDKADVRRFERTLKDWNKQGTYTFKFHCNEKTISLEAVRRQFEGNPYTLFVFTDITAEQAAADNMQEERDEALRLAAERSSFLSNMSHEIRTPMNGIMGMMSLAKMNITDTEKVLSYLDKAGNLASFLIGVINDILDISKMESGRMLLYNTNFDVFKFADKIYNMFSGTMQSKGLNYKVETKDFTVRVLVGDELRLTQIVTNLVSNAQKFTPVGGNVTVTFKQLDIIGDNIELMIRCRDTGKGIAPENIRKIMKPFEQEDSSVSHKYGGTGLGLALTDNFVRLMGGNIVVDSEVGKGSDFSVFLTLPVANVAQDMEVSTEEVKVEALDFSYEGCKILLAEDNEINAEIAMEILESEGAVVTHAKDGVDCVEIFQNNPPQSFDLILMDIQMPRMNGREATREIRKSKHDDAQSIVIIALSADAFVEDVVKSKEAGMDGHVSKPIDFDELKKTIGEIFAVKNKSYWERKK